MLLRKKNRFEIQISDRKETVGKEQMGSGNRVLLAVVCMSSTCPHFHIINYMITVGVNVGYF